MDLITSRNEFSMEIFMTSQPPSERRITASTRWITQAQLAAFEASATTAHRLFTDQDGWVERFGSDILLSYKHEGMRESLIAGLDNWARETGFSVQRIFGKLLPKQNEDRVAPVLIRGDEGASLITVVSENGVKYGLDFGAGYSAGLFLDQRANRSLVRRSGPKNVLNTFAYTCSFSVVAALAGAQTVSIDLSKKSLDRGRENFRLNDLDESGHRFLADDVVDVLPRLARRGDQFDTIILDPPTFSRGNKGRKFQVEQNLEDLLSGALEVATTSARILLSTNCTKLDRRTLEKLARYCLKLTRRQGSFHSEPDLPDIPPSLSAQTLWLMLR
ncbi:MAG TPA: class I SAM-dependent methyltransferase [Chthoniobacteraceae bacterium]|nr:class I SAM-dependent methyltransferase [Chthoniobacteraceae bacterium]